MGKKQIRMFLKHCKRFVSMFFRNSKKNRVQLLLLLVGKASAVMTVIDVC